MAPELGHLLDSLGWAILHSLWQGTLAAIAVVTFRSITKDSQAALRYGFQVACLFACLAAFIITLGLYQFQSHTAHMTVLSSGSTMEQITAIFSESSDAAAVGTSNFFETLTFYTPFLGILWCFGFILLAARYCGAFVITQRLRHVGTSDAPAEWQRRFETLVLNAGIRRRVKIYISSRVNGPLTLGFFKPIVLVPASFFAGMPAPQVEAILLHEIAHIRRHDYLINLFQTAIKTIFFFHPAVHYISRRIDNDREHACDDFAVSLTRDPQSLARGLAALRLEFAPDTFALAADNGNTPLVARLKRLGNVNDTRRRPEHVLTSAATLILAAGLYISTSPLANAKPPKPADKLAANDISHPSGADGNYRFEQISVDGKTVTAKIADDGTRWINVDGIWYDVDRNTHMINKLPAVPAAPKFPKATSGPDFNQYQVDLDYYIASLTYAELDVSEAEQTREQIEREVKKALAESEKEKNKAWEERSDDDYVDAMKPGVYIDGEYSDAATDKGFIKEFEREMTRIAKAQAKGKMSASSAEAAREAAHDRFDKKINHAQQTQDRAAKQREMAIKRAEHERERAIERAQEQMERAMERAEEIREREMERAQKQLQREIERADAERERALEQAEREREGAKNYKGFNDAMLKQLQKDGLIKPGMTSVTITYPNRKMTVNGVSVPHHLEGNYCEYLDAYGLKKTSRTKIKIKAKSFEYKASSEDGASSRHIHEDFDDHKNEHEKEAALTQPSAAKIRIAPAHKTDTNWTPARLETPVTTTAISWTPIKASAATPALSFTHPTPEGRVSQSFKYLNSAGKRHSGVDLAAPRETPIKASAPGIVTYAKTKGKWGNLIKITHDGGYETHYAHLGEICVAEGEEVSQGHNIGSVGSTGASTGPHLHFEIRHNGESLNPEDLVQGF